MEETYFAPNERSGADTLLYQHKLLRDNREFSDYFEKLPFIAAVMNNNRQIVFGNKLLLDFTGHETQNELLGARLGEAIECIESDTMAAGCGTSRYCRFCKAVHTIIESALKDSRSESICDIKLKNGRNLNLLVSVSPFKLQKESFLLMLLSGTISKKFQVFFSRETELLNNKLEEIISEG